MHPDGRAAIVAEDAHAAMGSLASKALVGCRLDESLYLSAARASTHLTTSPRYHAGLSPNADRARLTARSKPSVIGQ